MTIIAGALADASIGRSGLAAGLLQRTIQAAGGAIRRQRTRRALARLSDHTLKDIGLRRSEIDSIAESAAAGRRDVTRNPNRHFDFWI